ncbi:MAG: formylmethanofuran dehydrogenase subunit B, partial [Candidatus Bathyarchaeia archaeon]
TVCHGPTTIALQEVGISTCTLGEIKNRADLIIYWGCNPMHAHPRHLSRYTTFPRGFFRSRGQENRTLIVVDVRNTDTAKLAKYFLQVKPNGDYELFSALRLAIKGYKLPDNVAGVPREKIEELAKLMKSSQFVAIFFGLGVTMSGAKNRNIDNVLSLTRDLHRFTKCVIMPMRGHYNVTGFNEVSTWETGFPYAVDFTRGYPRYNPGETSAIELLMRGEIDAALVIASDPVAHFPKEAARQLMSIPIVAIDTHQSLTTEVADVVIPAAIAGIEAEGTAYRMDHVPIRLRKILDPPEGVLPDREILRKILETVKMLKGGAS